MKHSTSEAREHLMQLPARDAAALVEMIDNQPKPNEALAKAMARYQKKVKDGTLDTNPGRSGRWS